MDTGLAIKKHIEDRGMSQAFLSRKTGIGVAKLNLALNGMRKLSLDEYALICGVLEVDVNKFLHPRIPV